MRKPRYYYETNFYHIMVQGDEKKNIFKSDKNKKKMIYLLKHNAFRNDVEIISYCIMDNHAHILVFCPEIERVSKMMSQSNTSFGLYFTNKRQKVGHVFRERFRSESIFTKSHLINCIKYIHNNPVKARICKNVSDYYYSSYKSFSKIDKRIEDICNITNNDIDVIIRGEATITRFLDDEYSKSDINYAFEESQKLFSNVLEKDEKIAKQYIFLKENCKITDEEIAKLLKISRSTMNLKLKKAGIKWKSDKKGCPVLAEKISED